MSVPPSCLPTALHSNCFAPLRTVKAARPPPLSRLLGVRRLGSSPPPRLLPQTTSSTRLAAGAPLSAPPSPTPRLQPAASMAARLDLVP